MSIAGKRVLVVEDDWFMACETSEAVRQAGGEVVGPVPDAADADAAMASGSIDAALLDISLVEGTTFDLARRLIAAGIPVVFHSDWSRHFLPNDMAEVQLAPKSAGPEKAVACLMLD